MSCTDTFCYNIGELLSEIKNTFEKTCSNPECVGVLLPKERETLTEYATEEFLDRRTMEIVRCLIQNILKTKKDKSIKQFLYIPRHELTGRTNTQRNLLTGVRNFEALGIDTIVSDARFMGSIATFLRCSLTDFNKNTIKKLLNEPVWRMSSTFNQTQQQAMNALLGVFHSYIVGVLCGNPARTWTPNTAYTYGLYASQCPKTLRRNFCVMNETIPTVPKQNNVHLLLKNGRMTPDLFLSVFYQLGLTLEIMQSHSGYCHFDLVPENVVLRPVYQQAGNGMSWSYMMYGSQYTLHQIQFFATIHDYKYGCFNKSLLDTGSLTMQDTFIGMGKIKKYGVMDFIVPGFDMFVFLNGCRNIVDGTLDPNNTNHFLVDPYAQENNLRIRNFIDHILKEFYQLTVPPSDMKANYRSYNALMCKGAGLSPLGLVEKVSGVVKTLLDMKDPLTRSPRNAYLPSICKKKVPLFLTDLVPNWEECVSVLRPVSFLDVEEIPSTIDTLLNMIKNKQILFEFDYRPLMLSGGQVAMDPIDYYEKLVFDPSGYYNGYFENTLNFYNMMMTFLNTYYYKYHVQDKDYIEKFVENNDRLTVLFRQIQQPQFVSKIAGMVRFCQTVVGLKSAKERNFCCIKKKDGLGQMGKLQQQKIYQIVPETATQCGQQVSRRQQKQRQQQQKKQQIVVVQQQKQKPPATLTYPTASPVASQQKKQQAVAMQPTIQQKKQQAVAMQPPIQQKKQQIATVAYPTASPVASPLPPQVAIQQKKQQVIVPTTTTPLTQQQRRRLQATSAPPSSVFSALF